VQQARPGDPRSYFFCENCYLISVDKKCFPSGEKEKQRYLTHNNGIQFQGYVDFLSRAITPSLQFLRKGMTGLDYGCGHAPTLSRLMESHGYPCENYDPFFVKHPLDKKFDFIFSTEVFEHFFYPERELRKIKSLLNENGLLTVMTQRWKDRDHFAHWQYARDTTHVCFYHSRTFDFICEEFGFEKLHDDGRELLILKALEK